jgi:hypothetical protein
VAHLGGPEVLGERVWTEARRRNWTQAQDTIVLGEGAPWIWNLAQEHFFDSRQSVDGYQATEHLSNASRPSFPACLRRPYPGEGGYAT